MVRYGIIADDATGACDAALQLTNAGLRTVASFLPLAPNLDVEGFHALSLSTNSREEGPGEGRDSIRAACRFFKSLNLRAIYMKIDSTWRGNIGQEAEWILEELGLPFALISSSFPQRNRITVGNYLLSGTSTPLYLPPVLKTREPAGFIGLNHVRRGPAHIKEMLTEILTEKTRLILADSVTPGDLRTIVEGGLSLTRDLLFCGSAGMAGEWIRCLEEKKTATLVVIGSTHPANLGQVKAFLTEGEGELIEPDPRRLISPDPDGYLEALASRIASSMEGQSTPILRTVDETGTNILQEEEDAKNLAKALGRLVKKVLQKTTVDGLMVTGGDTLRALLEALEAEGVEILSEVEKGIPCATIRGGPHQGLFLVTKAGGFGSPRALLKALDVLHTLQPGKEKP